MNSAENRSVLRIKSITVVSDKLQEIRIFRRGSDDTLLRCFVDPLHAFKWPQDPLIGPIIVEDVLDLHISAEPLVTESLRAVVRAFDETGDSWAVEWRVKNGTFVPSAVFSEYL